MDEQEEARLLAIANGGASGGSDIDEDEEARLLALANGEEQSAPEQTKVEKPVEQPKLGNKREHLRDLLDVQRRVKASKAGVDPKVVAVANADEIPDDQLDSAIADAERFEKDGENAEAVAKERSKVERSKADIMRLEWQAKTGQKDGAFRYGFSSLMPFAGGDFEQEQIGKLTRMKDFAEGKPHLQSRIVGTGWNARMMTPEQAALGRAMGGSIFGDRRDTLDDMYADEAMALGLSRREATRGDNESRSEYTARLKSVFANRFKEHVARMDEAKRDLEQTNRTITDKIVVGGMPSIGYVGEMAAGGAIMKGAEGVKLGFDVFSRAGLAKLFTKEGGKQFAKVAGKKIAADAAKSMPATIAQTQRGVKEMSRDEYGLDENGNPVVIAEGDKGNVLGKAFRNSFTENLLENLVGEITRPFAGKVFSKIGKAGGRVGKFVNRAYQHYDRATKVTGFGDILFEELPEENVQYFFSDILGWGKKDSQYRGVVEELKHAFTDEGGQYTVGGQWNTALAMVMQMGIQASYAGGKTAIEHIDAKRDIGNQLERICGLTKEQVGKMSLEQRSAFANLWNQLADNPKELQTALEKAGGVLGQFADELTKQSTYRLENSISAYGETPRRFRVQSEAGADGKPRPKFSEAIHIDDITGETTTRKEMHDAESGVTVADNGTSYEVVDDIHLGRTYETESFDEAMHVANVFALQNQKQELDNNRKREYAKRLYETKYQNRKVFVVDHVSDVWRSFKNGIEQSEDGSFLGVKDLSQIFNPTTGVNDMPVMRGGNAGGFTTPDGTVVMILDNIADVTEMNKTFAHESGHAEGKEDAAKRQEMLRRVDPESDLGRMIADFQRRNEEGKLGYSDDAIRDEAFSFWLEERGHNPTLMQRFRHAAFGKVGKLGDADLEVIASQIEQASAGEDGEGEITFINEKGAMDETRTDEAPVESPEAEVAEPPAGEGEKPVESAEAGGETRDAVEETSETKGENDIRAAYRKKFIDGNEFALEEDSEIADLATDEELQSLLESADDAETLQELREAVKGRIAQSKKELEDSKKVVTADEAAAKRSTEEKAALVDVMDTTGLVVNDGETPEDNGDYISKYTRDRGIVRLNPHKLDTSDEGQPNFKGDADRKTGITKELPGEYQPALAGTIVVRMVKRDGKWKPVVVTGRHRVDLARRFNKPIYGRVYWEDEMSSDEATVVDAIANIHDGKGTINDYIRFYEKGNFTREQAERVGVLSDKGLAAWSIYKDATETVRSATALGEKRETGKIEPKRAMIIAEAAPRDAHERNPFIQSVLLRAARSDMGDDAFAGYAREMTRQLQSGSVNKNLLEGSQMDLFQDEEFLAMEALAKARNEYRAKRSSEYADIARNIRSALSNSDKLELTDAWAKDLGVTDKTDRQQLEKACDLANDRARYWDPAGDRILDDADVAAMDREINIKADANAQRKAELKARREAMKSGKPLPKRAKTEAKPAKVVQSAPAKTKAETTKVDEKKGSVPKSSPAEAAKPTEQPITAKSPIPEAPATGKTHKRLLNVSEGTRKKASAALAALKKSVDFRDENINPFRQTVLSGVSFRDETLNPAEFSARLGKLAEGVGNVVAALSEDGYSDFESVAKFIADEDAEMYEKMKPVMQDVWNMVARAKGLKRVSDETADEVFGIIDTQLKEVEDVGSIRRDQRSDDAGGGPLGGTLPADDASASKRGDVRGADSPGGAEGAEASVRGADGGSGRDLGDGARGRAAASGGADRGGKPGEGESSPGSDLGTDRRTVSVQPGEGQGEQRPASDGVDSGAEGNTGGLDAGRPGSGEGGERGGGHTKGAAQSVKNAANRAANEDGKDAPSDFVMTDAVEAAILERSPIKRVLNNVAAIQLLQKLKQRDFKATPEEQKTLAKYVGWGGLSEMFCREYERAWDSERNVDGGVDEETLSYLLRGAKYGREGYDAYRELRRTLNDEEYASARQTVLTAFYTPIPMVRLEHGALRKLGVKGGRFLGPSAGVGNYASAAGEYVKGARWQFVEKDEVSGQILRALFPNQRVHVGGYEDTKFADGFFDFAIDNVPYADLDITDKSLGKGSFKIHDYFFAKTLSKLRPGGVMMFLTSTGTLDKTDGKLRQFLSLHGGRIVGAVRLPNGFFSKNAGTDVASDLVVIQKMGGEVDNSGFMRQEKFGETTEWVRRKGQVKVDVSYNAYFKDHPEQVVGEMRPGTAQYGRPVLEYKMPQGDLFDMVGKAVDRALEGVDKDLLLKNAPKAVQVDHAPVYDDEGLRQGNITLKDGNLYEKSGDELVPVEMPKLDKRLAGKMLTAKQIVTKVLDMRKALRAVVDAEVKGMDDDNLAPLIEELNRVYDDFVKRVGTFHDKHITPFIMLDKADGNRLMTMEKVTKVDGKNVIEKADILKKRVIFKYVKPEHADNISDALTIAYSEMGALDLGRIAELRGVTEEEAEEELKREGRAFENPQTGRLEPFWEYLSGHVRRKLDAARAAVQNDASFKKNVEELEKVQPKDVSLDEVSIKFGATWADVEAMTDFIQQAYDLGSYERVKIARNDVTNRWDIEIARSSVEPFGTTSFSQEHFLSAVLNSESLEVKAKDPVTEKYYVLERQTEAQKLAAEKLHEAFARFLRTSEKWFEPSTRSFNYAMNDNVPMKLPKNILPFRAAGMSEETIAKLHAKGREYQPDVIARGVLGGRSLCLAHCVGAGKTLEMQSIGMIGRHLGMFKKSMYVVPNHMLDQFCNEFLAAFPNANILKMSTEDVKPANRRAFFAKVANGDWDAIVVKHSTFSQKLPMTRQWQVDYLEREVRRLVEAKLAAKGDSGTVKDIEKMIAKAREKIESLSNDDKKDKEIVPFEELGVDQLFVDEAHNFKGLPVVSAQARKTKGLAQGDSQRALDMEMKTQYVQSLHGDRRGVVFATGTPLSNAPVVEAYVMLRYLAPWALEEAGVRNFDDFVNTFGRIETESEFDLSGRSTKEVQRVTAFLNIPEMMRLFKSVVDIVNSDQIQVKRPTPKLIPVPVKMSRAQEVIMEMVAKQSAIPASKEERGKFLTLTGIAKRACISPRLLGVDDDGSKIAACAAKIKEIYEETKDVRGAQLVFSDIFNESGAAGVLQYVGRLDGVNYNGAKWNLNAALRDLLVRAGIPASEIGIIHDVDKAKGGDEGKDAAKEALFAKVRSGEIRVLIGSRPRMGEGTNVQERLAAIHLLHPGWKPSEDTQAIGRIIRPGNMFETGRIFYYLTQGNQNVGSYETKNHELIGKKDKLISAVMHGDETIREIDMDEAAAERDMLMGLASANQDLIKLIDVRRALHKAELNVENVAFSARSNNDNADRTERALEKMRGEFEESEAGAREWRKQNPDGRFVLTTVDGREIDKVKDIADYVSGEVSKQLTKDRYDREEDLEIGNFGGIPLKLVYTFFDNRMRLAIPSLGVEREVAFSGFLPDFSVAAMTAFKTRVLNETSPDVEEVHKNALAETEGRIKRLREDAKRFNDEWEKEKARLASLRTERARLERSVSPLVITATQDRKYVAYGNWFIAKRGENYIAVRGADEKRIGGKTVKELLDRMDAEDFASPTMSVNKTEDIKSHLKPDSKGIYPTTDEVKREAVDFRDERLNPREEKTPDDYIIIIYGNSGTERIKTRAVSLPQAISRAKFRYITGGENRELTPMEKREFAQLDARPYSIRGIYRPKGYAIIKNTDEARRIEKAVLDWIRANNSGKGAGTGNEPAGVPGGNDSVRPGVAQNGAAAGGNGAVAGGSERQGRSGNATPGEAAANGAPRTGAAVQSTFADFFGVEFRDENLTPEAVAEQSEDEQMKTFGMTQADVTLRMRAAKMEPPKHMRKSDAQTIQQAEVLLSSPSYMAKLAHAVFKWGYGGRPIADYENWALDVYARQLGDEVAELQGWIDDAKAIVDKGGELDADMKRELASTKEELKIKRQLMYEANVAKKQGVTKAARALRSNRQRVYEDYSFAGILNKLIEESGGLNENGEDRLTPEMRSLAREISEDLSKITDEDARQLFVEVMKGLSEKKMEEILKRGKIRQASEPKVGDEAKRVKRNYFEALAQIEVHAAGAADSLIGLSDQMYPSWGRWLEMLAEYHTYVNPNITEDELVAAMAEDVKPFLANVDADQIRDIWTGFGMNYRQSHFESQRQAHDLRAQARLKRQLDYMDEHNQLPPATGMIRDEPSLDTRKLQHEVQERKKEVDETTGGQNRLKGLLQSAKTRTQNRIDELKDAIERGEAIPRKERKIVDDLELRRMRDELADWQKRYDEMFKTEKGLTDEQRLKMRERALAKQLERLMGDLARARLGDFSKAPKRPEMKSAVTDSLIDKIEETRKEILDIKKATLPFGKTPEEINALNERKITDRENRIQRISERIALGDIDNLKKPQPPMTPEQQERYDELGRQQKRAMQKLNELRKQARELAWFAPVRAAKNTFMFLNSLHTATMASFDRSAVLRQALKLSLAHPKLALFDYAKAERAAWSERRFNEINAEILADPIIKEAEEKFGLKMRSSDIANVHDIEMFRGANSEPPNWIKRINELIDGVPVLGGSWAKIRQFHRAALANSERHYVTYLNLMAAQSYKLLLDATPGASDFQKRKFADLVNMLSGSGAMSAKTRNAINAVNDTFGHVIWSPSLWTSQIQQKIYWDVINPFIGDHKDAGANSRREAAKVATEAAKLRLRAELATLAIGAMIALLWSDDDWWEEFKRKGIFTKWNMLKHPVIGKAHIDLEMGERTFDKFASALVTGERETSTGRRVKLGDYGVGDIFSMFGRYVGGKLSPTYSKVVALLQGKDYVGQPFGMKELLLSAFPLSISDVAQTAVEDDWLTGAAPAAMLLTVLGAGGNVYDEKYYERAVNPFIEAEKEYRRVESDNDLSDEEREKRLASMREDNPLLGDGIRDELIVHGRTKNSGLVPDAKRAERRLKEVQSDPSATPEDVTEAEREYKDAREAVLKFIRQHY
mgnify:CR=1 FL=1